MEELNEVVQKSRKKRQSRNLTDEEVTFLTKGEQIGYSYNSIPEHKETSSCDEDGLNYEKCSSFGLGIQLPKLPDTYSGPEEENIDPRKQLQTQSRLTAAPSFKELDVAPQPRHWWTEDTKDCTKTFSSSSKTWTSTLTSKASSLLSPQVASSPTLFSTAPPTPTLNSQSFSTPSTPVVPFTIPTTDPAQHQQQQQQQQNGTSSSFSFSHHDNHATTAVASIGAAGSALLLAAVLLALYFRRQRSKQYKQHMEAVLDKVAPPMPPSSSEKAGNQKEQAITDQGPIGSTDRDSPTSQQPLELRMVSPWLSYDMGTHPFASAAVRSDKLSPDLAQSGIVGHQVSNKDCSFTWSFPKLSVPPAAARAIVTSHYVKKKVTIPRIAHLNNDTFQQQKLKSSSSSSMTERENRTGNSFQEANLITSSSSECVDPEFDHRRKSFAVVIDARPPSASGSASVGWFQSALKHFSPLQQEKRYPSLRVDQSDLSTISSPWIPSISSRRTISQSSEDRSISLSSQKGADSYIHSVSGNFALTEAVVQQVLEIRLPSLSVANSPMLDVADSSTSSKQSSRIPLPKWSNDGNAKMNPPQRSASDGSSEGNISNAQVVTRCPRRVSWAGPLETCREDSKESMHTAQSSPIKPSSTTKAIELRRSRAWTCQDTTDTEDETREGYEAEQENDTEVEVDDVEKKKFNLLDTTCSTPIITLTCSEEEGRFERRISLTSASCDNASSDDNHHGHGNVLIHQEKETMTSSENSEDDLTVVIHSWEGQGLYNDEVETEEEGDYLGQVDCLLDDEFPTIPEWTPIASPLRAIS